MWKDVSQFCHTCDICQKTKPDLRGKKGLLRPHRVPQLPWDIISLNLITGLPQSQNFDVILVVVDKLTKYVVYVPWSPCCISSNLPASSSITLYSHLAFPWI